MIEKMTPTTISVAGACVGLLPTGVNSAGVIVFTTTLAMGPATVEKIQRIASNPNFNFGHLLDFDHLNDVDSYRLIMAAAGSKVSQIILLPLNINRCLLGLSCMGTIVPPARLILSSESRDARVHLVGLSLLHMGGLILFNTVTTASVIGLQTLGVIGDWDDEEASAFKGTMVGMLTAMAIATGTSLYRKWTNPPPAED